MLGENNTINIVDQRKVREQLGPGELAREPLPTQEKACLAPLHLAAQRFSYPRRPIFLCAVNEQSPLLLPKYLEGRERPILDPWFQPNSLRQVEKVVITGKQSEKCS